MNKLDTITPREREVLCLIGEGLSSKQVADRLCLAKRTVDFHLARVYGKLDVSNRLEALRYIRIHTSEDDKEFYPIIRN